MPCHVSITLISFYIMVISKVAAKIATVTLKLAYLLNYLLQISREGVSLGILETHISVSDQSSYTDDVI